MRSRTPTASAVLGLEQADVDRPESWAPTRPVWAG